MSVGIGERGPPPEILPQLRHEKVGHDLQRVALYADQ
jgi:hypothetical protein